ncbi:MAG: ATP synthase F1 subunit delta [Firmicutes bacterium]|nr:ATP synthase F1 subunit delta [Bacillota bacterium]
MTATKHSQVARRYAEALFATADPAARSQLKAEFEHVLTILGDPKVKDVFHHPRTSRERKGEMIKLMQLSPIMENFLLLIVEKSRETLLASIAHYFEQLVLEAQHTTIAEVISAIPLSAETLTGLEQKLNQFTGKTVHLNTHIDSSIGGGLVIRVDGKVLDGSVTNTLKQFQRSLIS